MRAWLLVLCVGCARDAVVVEIDTNGLDVSSVELVLSNRTCQDPLRGDVCASIQGPNFETGLGRAGDIYARDASATIRDLDRGIARFELPSDDHTLAMAFAIGRDAQGQIVGSAVMAGTLDLTRSPIVYRATLDATSELFDGQPGRTAAAVQWGERDQCVGIAPLSSTDGRRPIFLLPDDDPDCDGRITAADGECDPLWFDGFLLEATDALCVQPSAILEGSPCTIGSVPQCIETDVTAPCVESPIRCVPDAVCASCEPTNVACQNAKLHTPTDGGIECTFPAQLDGAQNLFVGCPGDNAFFLEPLGLSAGARCTDAKLALTPLAAIDSPLVDQLTINGATFEVGSVDDTCATPLKWTGTLANTTPVITVLVLFVEVDGDIRQLWFPIRFSPTLVCPLEGEATGCTYDANNPDHILDCTR